ncbi:hypothetical protein F0562_009259 [Nyssa sinensis]|uniref:Uncharacterized protein n=1 Tax=Nyssa sinensis TaxID=561372 RepID=A0A5J4ZYC5_9ASTE|nr:hypothetical protein F0562_009259 [Nyssa sinensis]
MDVTEEIRDIRIRVFKWNEKLFNHKALESHGLFLFRVANKIKKVSYSKDGGVNEVTEFRNQKDVLGFRLDRLLSRDSIEALSRCVVAGTELFFVDTAATLAKLISVYLLLSYEDQEKMDIFELGSQDEDQLADDIEVDQEDETEDDSNGYGLR